MSLIQFAGILLLVISLGILSWAYFIHRGMKSPLTLDEEKKWAKTRITYRLLESAGAMILGLVFLWDPF